jgi:hypothetical protein
MLPGGVGDNLKYRHSANEPSSPGLIVLACDLVFVLLSFGEMEVSLVSVSPGVFFRCCLTLGPLFRVWDVICSCSESVVKKLESRIDLT